MSRFFEDRTGRNVRVAILDSGVHAAHPHVGGVAGGVALLADGSEGADYVDRVGHGTAVAAAIREKAPEAELVAIKIFESGLSTTVGTLVRAIDWAVTHSAHAINLSAGLTPEGDVRALADACERARAAGVVVVAAAGDDGASWPSGRLPSVIGVLLDWDCPRHEYRIGRLASGAVGFKASGYPREIPGVPRDRNLRGLSFAVANMTGFVARALEAHPGIGLDDLRERLQRGADQS